MAEKSVNVQQVEILGDQVTTWRDNRTRKTYVECRGRCEFLGITWSGQYEKLTKSAFFSRHLNRSVIRTEQGDREMIGLEVKYARVWLAGISPERVRPEVQEQLIDYLERVAEVLDRHWHERTPTLRDYRDIAFQKGESKDYNRHIQETGGNYRHMNAQICRDLSDQHLNPSDYVVLVKEQLKEQGKRYGHIVSGQDALREVEPHSAAASAFQKHYVVRGHVYEKVLPVSASAKETFKLMAMTGLPIGELEEGEA
jgi:hypothetical protein